MIPSRTARLSPARGAFRRPHPALRADRRSRHHHPAARGEIDLEAEIRSDTRSVLPLVEGLLAPELADAALAAVRAVPGGEEAVLLGEVREEPAP